MKTLSRIVEDALANHRRVRKSSNFKTIGIAKRYARRAIALDEFGSEIEAVLREKEIPASLVNPVAEILYQGVWD